MPVWVSHGEGHAELAHGAVMKATLEFGIAAIEHVDNFGQPTIQYPNDPNG
ncbi:phosphoribosylformylglycinamidine synthase subunit PurQ [Pseudoalteromonas luteoviolacea]|uniref:Uncharacterized protein n=1 Tax=Pseudoalteromonas luteoviolacea H33 TaxID=1365251 RepID=A0A167FNS5_9GAMM|nr:phosphoribosylformylglycinamidine synthase subunit PurQ [Pseudoalteromonas luteoviolacea]KZN52565.1 hypothetical protein N476_10910 [Pseudoalteromonas luteoviolacea H33]KZN76503.1 hypothetical protein N477_15445 [Pseudoalteromonas luteoviolacea H33-S]MBQ4876999.1 phosphoribosylformylglycinamidine synthase subunit PurQ [Pseudoalteromonas luteoviolacea]MBQ4905860.1 phosphoribosylformylglycinamidine synthase subunit PurQ [Pseudoalteromonas luteoviolacea]